MSVMIHSMLCSLNDILQAKRSIYDSQSNPLMIRPENMVESDHVAALNDNASVLFSELVLRMMNGNEHTP